jgi:argininosuccinate lyase
MLKQAEEGFAGATSLMEWMVASFRLPLRKAKGVMEKAVKYSEKEGKGEVTFKSLKKALREMKVDLSLSEQDVKKVQRPERILSQSLAIGTPSAKRVQENLSSLREKVKESRAWLTLRRRKIEKAKELMGRMERQIRN